MNPYEASDVWWGGVEIDVFTFYILIYNLLAFFYGRSDRVLVFFSGIFINFREIVFDNKCLNFIVI